MQNSKKKKKSYTTGLIGYNRLPLTVKVVCTAKNPIYIYFHISYPKLPKKILFFLRPITGRFGKLIPAEDFAGCFPDVQKLAGGLA